MGKPWCTVPLEVGHNEIGDADVAEWVELVDAAELFGKVGLPAPGRVPIMSLNHQIAQKIHAVSSVGDRARDLVDLQLIFGRTEVDLPTLRMTCERLFAYRKAQEWPPKVIEQPGWAELYAVQAEGLPVVRSVGEAIDWVNSLIDRIRQAG